MSGFYLTNKEIKNENAVNKFLSFRGKDKQLNVKIEKFHFMYNIMLMYDETDIWYGNDEIILLYDGVIYNCVGKSFSGMAKFLYEMYREYGTSFTQKLDGEYAFCLIDLKKSIAIFSMDIFGTKPLWFSVDESLSVGSYKSALEGNDDLNIIKAEPNTTYVCDYVNGNLTQYEIHKFVLNQHKNTYDDWIAAFEKAVEKRLDDNGVGLGLSSGYDSGAIFCELNRKNNKFKSFSFRSRESQDILESRVNLNENASLSQYEEGEFLVTLKELYRNCEPFIEEYFELLKDEASTGLAIICKRLKKHGISVYLTGYGADEIISDYGFNGEKIGVLSEFGGLFPEDLTTIYPWKNFFGGCQKVYLAREEYVCGCYGLQVRFPFLDTDVVQEFLWLTSELKNKNYKAPIQSYFEKYNFPFRNEKIGFFMR